MNACRQLLTVLILVLFVSAALAIEPARAAPPKGTGGGSGIEVDAGMLRQILEDYLEDQQSRLPGVVIRLRDPQFPRPFVLPPGAISHQIIPSNPKVIGSTRFTVIFRIDGQTVKNLSVRGGVEAIAPVVVAAVDLPRGAVLSEIDLSLVEQDIARLKNPVFDPDEVIGKKLKRGLRMGRPLDRAAVEFPPMIKRGDLVTIILKSGKLEMTALGEARQNGLEGETIRVKNKNSNRTILGRVVAPGTVVVEYGQ